MRSVALAASVYPVNELEVDMTYMAGLERALTRLDDPALSFRAELNVTGTYALTNRLSFAVAVDDAHDRADGGVSWWGIGSYIHATLLPWLSGTVRGEHFSDPEGFTTGTPQRLAELTGTLETKQRMGIFTVIERFEYRRDHSDAAVFQAALPPNRTHQDTLCVGIMALF